MVHFPLRRHWIGPIRLAFTLLGLPQTLCTSGIRTPISCSPSHPFPTTKTTRAISSSYCRLYPTMPSSERPHVKSRCPQYPGSNIKRFPVPDDKVDWAQQWPQYDPVSYTAPLILNKPAWADPDIGTFSPKFNTVDSAVDRTSFEGSYKVENGKPLNPHGRTGLAGRGLLGRWGPNHAADPVVTRWKVDAKGAKIHHSVSARPILQFVSIKRKDCGEWAIPGGMVDPGEQVSLTLQREFSEEALNSLSASPEDRAKIQERITNLFKSSGFEVYKGYVDDPRNTDNAWMETVAVNFHDDEGLITVAESVGVKLLPPRKKITVMLMGNHSAGKSSFINWYVEEHIQRTGVAIETQGFSFVTSGRKRESLTGNATLHLYPHFKPLQKFKGVSEYLSTEICTSRQKRFSLVTFVDSPGLVDGDMKYPFDVDEVILWLGDLCDLILVFFDPMGQALCKRTLNIVESLNEKHGDRLRFYLSKADEAGGESDRQRVMMQIVQELCKRPGLNKCGFDMPTIYIPNPNKPSRCVNQIEEVCRTIEKTINQTVQNTLNSLERDCELIVEAITDKLSNDRQTTVENRRARCKSCFLTLLGFCVPLTLLAFLVLGALSQDLLKVALGKEGTEALALYLTPIVRIFDSLPVEQRLYGCAGLVLLSFLLLIIARFIFRTRPTLSNKQKRQLQEKLEYVKEVVKTKKKKLYEEYLRQSVSDHDMGL